MPWGTKHAKSHQELEARLLRACEIEADCWRQISARRQFASLAGQLMGLDSEMLFKQGLMGQLCTLVCASERERE